MSKSLAFTSIAGKSIPYTVYQQKVDDLESIYKIRSQQNTLDEETIDNIRMASWENLIQEIVLDKELKKLGIAVHPDELFDMIPDPSAYTKEPAEGIVIENLKHNIRGKIVRAEFQSSMDQSGHWMHKQMVINKLCKGPCCNEE